MLESIKERKKLRNKILFDLYDFYFENGGEEKNINVNDTQKNPEDRLAFRYLSEMGLINFEPRVGNRVALIIKAKGITYVEKMYHKKNENESDESDDLVDP